ncbi:MAG TPA: HD domain-containing protein [Salinimicrobium sp.]|nr:HD domain-containing protein [Salinimicrobium sp.]
MNREQIIQNTEEFVKQALKDAEAGHDWFHIQRVLKNSLVIAEEEKVDLFVVKLGALLHDIADSKFHDGNENIGPEKAQGFLKSQGVEEHIIEHVVNIIRNISFKGGNTTADFFSRELAIIQDADRLDAIGAIGIARTFNYGGYKGRLLYDPEVKPNLEQTKEEYKNSKAPTINHFYEKLLLLKDRMNTKKGREMAEERHVFMQRFLKQFYEEWG